MSAIVVWYFDGLRFECQTIYPAKGYVGQVVGQVKRKRGLFGVNQGTMGESGQPFPIQKSNLYQIWWEEKEHIAKNRWYLSEKMGFDVGYEMAVHNWNMCHRQGWISGLKAEGRYPSS